MRFSSDNWAGVSEAVAASLTRHSSGFEPAYGSDELTGRIVERFSDIFEKEVAVFYVATGTAANALALSQFAKPGGAIFCHRNAHIRCDECGAPEFLSNGNRLIGLDGSNGKFSADAFKHALSSVPEGAVMSGQASSVSLSQGTESGTVYSVPELQEIAIAAHERNIPLHMDGARFANGLASLDVSPADMTWRAGVDVLSFGGTKNGCWSAEAVVFFNPDQAEGFAYLQKRSGHVFSKARFVSAQFDAYFEDDHWLSNARHANAMAHDLADGIASTGGRTLWPVEINEVFPVLKRAQVDRLRAEGAAFYEWTVEPEEGSDKLISEDEVALRLVTSFATSPGEVEKFVSLL
ncbi:MAG: low specificity L-threonine aldolase [Rhodobacteraceae bacterium]|nr:low specificity L-threonine aldolase [Paracoccaceae bacterium]